MIAVGYGTVTRWMSLVLTVLLVSQATAPLAAYAAISDPSWQKGATIRPFGPTDYASSNFQQSLRNFKAMGGTHVNLIVPYIQSNTSSADIGPAYNTPTDSALISGIQYAHSIGLKVMLSAYVESATGEWRAYINPSDRAAWFANYGTFLNKYAQIAAQQGVESYTLGAEIISVTSAYVNPDNTQRWNTLIANVRSRYPGVVMYSANRGVPGDAFLSEANNIQFWDKLDVMGISAYYEFPGDGSVSSLTRAWQGVNDYDITPLANRWHKPIVFTEVGYRSVTNAHAAPWDSGMGGAYDPQEQVHDFTALFTYWNDHPTVQGIFIWWWSADPNYGGAGNTDYTPQNKPAQDVLKQWWLTTPPPSNATFSVSGSATPNPASAGQSVSYSVNVTDTSGSASGVVVDVEIYNGATRVYQRVISGQTFSNGQTQTYSGTWTPPTNGSYTLKVGIFSSDWSKLYLWNDAVTTITVGGPISGGVIDTWWPVDGAHVSGVQPFKALLQNALLSHYAMYWQVDGDRLNAMYDSQDGYPHKEAYVDLTGWRWSTTGMYTLTFIAKSLSGATLSQRSIRIWVP